MGRTVGWTGGNMWDTGKTTTSMGTGCILGQMVATTKAIMKMIRSTATVATRGATAACTKGNGPKGNNTGRGRIFCRMGTRRLAFGTTVKEKIGSPNQ